jgi:hypothetical protein
MDPLTRLDRYKASHPDVIITPPSKDGSGFWEAHKDGKPIGSGFQLDQLLDRLDIITWPLTEH